MKRKLLFVAALVVSALGFNANAQQVWLKTNLTGQFSSLTVPDNWSAYNGDRGKECGAAAAPWQEVDGQGLKAMVENYQTTCDFTGEILWQEVKGLSAGTYEIKLYGAAAYTPGRGFNSELFISDGGNPWGGGWSAEDPIEKGGVFLYATSSKGTEELEIPANKASDFKTVATATLNIEIGNDGKVTIGLKKTSKGTNWHIVQLKSVSATVDAVELLNNTRAEAEKLLESSAGVKGSEKKALETALAAKPEKEEGEAYEEVIQSLQKEIDAFKAVKANYDLLAKEITKAKALGVDNVEKYAGTTDESTADEFVKMVQDLKVAEYEYVKEEFPHSVKLGEWTGTGTNTKPAEFFRGEHWTGSKERGYMNQYDDPIDGKKSGWNASSWTLNFTQNVVIPKGSYVFKVAARQASNAEHMKTSLIVKKGEETLGTVDDFPTMGAEGRGVNIDGDTSFDEENEKYANNGKGFGWEWRYVKFTLDEEAEVNLTVNAVATANQMWVSFCDYTLQTDNDAVIATIAYNVALNDAKTAVGNDIYKNVTGEEKTALDNLIAKEEEVKASSTEEIEEATEALNAAIAIFKAAKENYDAFAAAKAVQYDLNLPYASEVKKNAVVSAQTATATSAQDATVKANAIVSAYRAYVESNALAEGVEGSIDYTGDIENANAQQGDKNAVWPGQAYGWTNTYDKMEIKSNESMTDASGKSDIPYFDTGDYWGDESWDITMTQEVELPAGKYLLTVSARCHAGLEAFELIGGDKTADMKKSGSTGGTFNRGWEDNYVEFENLAKGNVKIGIHGKTSTVNTWMSFTRFRLVRLGDAKVKTPEIGDAEWATWVTTAAVDFGEKVEAYVVSEVDGDFAKLDPVQSVPANTPVILHGNGEYELTVVDDATEPENNKLKVSDGNVTKKEGIYVLANLDNEVGFYALGGNYTLTEGKVYLDVSGTEVKFIGFNFGGNSTAIKGVETTTAEETVIYNIAGQRVVNPTKGGIYIVNGKKVLVK